MFREHDSAEKEPKDYTRYLWAGIGLAILLMIGLILSLGESKPNQSQVRTKHILIKFDRSDPADRARALKLIQELRQRIVDGESFEEIARTYSDDPVTASRGGDIGYQARGTMEQKYDEFSWQAPLNELSGIVQTNYGYHLIVVTDRYISPNDAYERELERRVTAPEEAAATPDDGATPPESSAGGEPADP